MSALAPLGIVVAMARNRVIGRDGGLPWHVPEDLKRFRAVTMGHAIIMGRKTHESIGKALPGRRNLVVSRGQQTFTGAERCASLEEAVALARAGGDALPMVIGGATLYERALPVATRLFLTTLERDEPGDTWFPPYDEAEWKLVAEHPAPEGVRFLELERAASS